MIKKARQINNSLGGRDMTKVKTAIVLSDMHLPYTDFETMKAVEAFIAERRWDYYVVLGDFLDFDFLSKFNREAHRKNEARRLKQDYALANDMLDRHQKLVKAKNRAAQFVFLEGNHEARVETYIDREPAAEGLLEVKNGLHLDDRKFRWIPQDEVFQIGNAHFIHGKFCNQYHAAKTALRYGVNVFYGHTHDVQTYSLHQWGEGKTLVGQSLGCLCDEKAVGKYLKGNPTNWQQAFGVFEFFPDGFFNYYVVRIFKHRFVFNGRVYGGRKLK